MLCEMNLSFFLSLSSIVHFIWRGVHDVVVYRNGMGFLPSIFFHTFLRFFLFFQKVLYDEANIFMLQNYTELSTAMVWYKGFSNWRFFSRISLGFLRMSC